MSCLCPVPSSPASRRARPGICISAMSARPGRAGGRRARPAGGFCCGSRISTGPAAGRNSPRRSSRISPGSGSPGTAPVRRQSEHFGDYRAALDRLDAAGAALSVLLHAARHPGRDRPRRRRAARRAGRALSRHLPPARRGGARRSGWRRRSDYALRLDVAAALARTGPLDWFEDGRAHRRRSGRARRCRAGAQGVADELSPRGHGRRRAAGRDAGDARRRSVRRDRISTACCRRCSACRRRDYRHHPLLTDAAGRRLAKRDNAR